MMQSSITKKENRKLADTNQKSEVRSQKSEKNLAFGMWHLASGLTTLALIATSFFTLGSRAHALTISLSKPPVDSSLASVAIDQWAAVSGVDGRLHIVYTTGSAAPYSIMLASQATASNYSLSLISTTSVRPLYLSAVIGTDQKIHVFYYDSSSKTINYFDGTTDNKNAPKFVGNAGARNMLASGLKGTILGSHFILGYTSQTAQGTYDLILASVAVANITNSAGNVTYINVSTKTENVSGGVFGTYTDENNALSVVYIDNSQNALRKVDISGTAAVEASRETIDTDSSLDGTLAISGHGSNITRIVYSYSDGVKLAVQRRLISPQCWYIQKIDSGKAQSISNLDWGANQVAVSYIKNSNLWVAVGDTNGIFFDDFSESIRGRQQGLAKIADSVTAGGFFQNSGNIGRRPFGAYQGATGLNTISGLTVAGTVGNSFGNALPSIRVKTKPDASEVSDEGGLTDDAGFYEIVVASASSLLVAPSSSPWTFYVSPASISVSGEHIIIQSSNTTTAPGASNGGFAADPMFIDFLAFSTPTIRASSHTNADGSNLSGNTFAVTYSTGGVGASEVFESTFAFETGQLRISDRFPRGGLFRFAPQTAQGIGFTLDETTGTVPQFQHPSRTLRHVALRNTGSSYAESATTRLGVLGRFTGIVASTDIPEGLWYTLIYSTRVKVGGETTATVMQSRLVDALRLQPLKIDMVVSSTTLGLSGAGPVLSSDHISASSATFHLINLSSNNAFPFPSGGAVNSGMLIFLSTNSNLALTPAEIGAKIPMGAINSSSGTNANVLVTTVSIFGLKSDTNNDGTPDQWYVRIATQIGGIWHSARAPISFSTPTITSVRATVGSAFDSGILVVGSGAATTVNINGTGLTPGSSVYFTTHTSIHFNGLPVPADSIATASGFTFQSSTWVQATLTVPNNVTSGDFYVWVVRTEDRDHYKDQDTFAVRNSTVIARSNAPLIRVSTRAVVNVTLVNDPTANLADTSNPVIANTREYELRIEGVGLMAGSSVTFTSVTGSSGTIIKTLDAVSSGPGSSARFGKVKVDFRGVDPGKFYTITLSSAPTFDGTYPVGTGTVHIMAGMTKTGVPGDFTNNVVWVGSMTISTVITPTTDLLPGQIYNTTGPVTIKLVGAGLVGGSTVTFTRASDGAVVVASAAAEAADGILSTMLGENTVSVGVPAADDGRTMLIVSSGAFAGGTAGIGDRGGLFGSGSTGNWTITVTTVAAPTGGASARPITATNQVIVVAASVSSFTANNNTNFNTLNWSSFTITGTGLMDGTSVFLTSTETGATIVVGHRTGAPDEGTANALSLANTTRNRIFTVSRTSAVVDFDLRSASGTATSWTPTIRKRHTVSTTAVVDFTPSAVTINRKPTLSGISPTQVSAARTGGIPIALHGAGLSAGATVSFRYVDTIPSVGKVVGGTELSTGPSPNNTFRYTLGGTTRLGSTGTFSLPATTDPDGNLMPGKWRITVSTTLVATNYGTIGGAAPSGGVGGKLDTDQTYASDESSFDFIVVESSAPNVPTGLTVIASGLDSNQKGFVTLQWIVPGNDGTVGTMGSGSGFLVYYSSQSDERGQGCAACYPVAVSTGGNASFTFAHTWAQYLAFGQLDSAITTTAASGLWFNTTTTTVKGLVVKVTTAAVGDSNLKKVVSTTTGETTAATSFSPGDIVQYTFNPNPNFTKTGKFWFVVRAFDEARNTSRTDVYHTTVSAVVPSGAVSGVPPTSSSGQTTFDPNTGGTAVLTYEISGLGSVTLTLDLAAGTFDSAVDLTQITAESVPSQAAVSGVITVGPALNFGALPQPKKVVPVKMTFTPSLVSAAGISNVNELSLLTYDVAKGKSLTKVPVSIVDSLNNTVTGKVSSFSSFVVGKAAVPISPSQVAIGPNPARPAQGDTEITFSNLPANTTIKIYTIAGDLVRELTTGNALNATWDLKNDKGENVASGVYFALLKGPGGTATAKVAVQR